MGVVRAAAFGSVAKWREHRGTPHRIALSSRDECRGVASFATRRFDECDFAAAAVGVTAAMGMRIGLVAPQPPQIGGVTSVAEWLRGNAEEIGCTYDVFDLRRPMMAGAGGRVTAAAIVNQVGLLLRFFCWMLRCPRQIHYCLSCTPTGLLRDAFYVMVLHARGRSLLIHVHGADLGNALRSPLRSRLLRLVSGVASDLVAVAPQPAAEFRRAGIIARHIYNPVMLDPPATRPTSNAETEFRLLFVGTYGARKGTPELVRALAIARQAGVPAVLTVVGPPEHPADAERVRSLVLSEGVASATTFRGPLDRAALAGLYAEADAFCLPSHREGLPMAILEAMESALPIIATPVGGIPDLVEDGQSGILVGPGDVEQLVGAITELACDPARRAALGKRARERVNEVAGDAILVREWQLAYARLCRAKDVPQASRTK
jgi:glycosyltransferase involved in cell wall biosynthesis